MYSVLMAVYRKDNPLFFSKAIKSMINQTVPSDDFVIVCDGSLTDDLNDVIDGFCSEYPFFNIVRLDSNHGLGYALNEGLKVCRYELVARMDSDDLSAPDRIETQLAVLEKHPEVDVIGTDITEFIITPGDSGRVRSCPAAHDDIVKMSKSRCPVNHVTVIMKKQAVIDCGGYSELLQIEDYFLWIKMLIAGKKFMNINKSLVDVRLGSEFEKKRGDKVRVAGWNEIQKYMLEQNYITKAQALKNMIMINCFVRMPPCMRGRCYKAFLRK